MIEGKDVSGYQPNFSPAADDHFVIIKASEGTSYRNPDRAGQVLRARTGGRVIGWYHWLHRGNIPAQAAYFVATSGIADGDLLICDWEGSQIPTCAEKDTFIRAVKALRPHSRVGLYCNTYTWKSVDTTSYCGDFLHIAQYTSGSPSIKAPWTIWQYSDGGGKLDHNKANFPTRAAMKAWADGLKSKPKPVPKPLPKPKPAGLPKLKVSDFNAARSDIHRARTVQAHPLTVHRAEWALHDFGFGSPDLIDGHYGLRTDLSVRDFQKLVSPGAKPDGILGPLEWARLAAGPRDGKHPARFIPA